MNTLAEVMGITCTADIGLMSIEYTCFDGQDGFTQSLCLTNTGVNTSKLNRLENFIREFEIDGKDMSGEELHSLLDDIERIHGLYSPIALGFAAALALLRIYISPRRRTGGNVLCFCRCRLWKLSSLQTDKASLHTFPLHCVIRFTGMSGICRISENRRNAVGYFHSA